MRLQALCLDLDGTLLDNSGGDEALRRACFLVAARLDGISAEDVLAANGEAWRLYWPEMEPVWTAGSVSGEQVSLEAWRRTLAGCGCDDQALARFARESHAAYVRAAMKLFDDAEKLLALLPAGLPLALITNGASDTQREKLDVLGLAGRFDVVVISGEIGAAKPAAAIFEAALERLGVGREAVWHVGDNLATDVAGANAAGMRSVWVNRNGAIPDGVEKAHQEVRSLVDLAVLLGNQP